MGWLFTHKPKGGSLTDFFVNHGGLRWTDPAVRYTVLDSALVNFTEYYAAVERVELATGKREVWAAVFLVRMIRNPADGHNFGYKDMDETCGPNYYNCPARILDLLTPTENDYASKWRAICRERLAKLKQIPVLKPGRAIDFVPALEFSGGAKHEHMKVKTVRGSRIVLTDEDGNPWYRLSRQALNRMIEHGRATFPQLA